MTDYFSPKLEAGELMTLSSLALAHVGDGVFELMVRTWLAEDGRATAADMHRETIKCVNAAAQSRFARLIHPLLTEEEQAVYRRGRNTRVNSVPRHMSVSDYHSATGFEALFGWLWLDGKRDRLNELFAVIAEEMKDQASPKRKISDVWEG